MECAKKEGNENPKEEPKDPKKQREKIIQKDRGDEQTHKSIQTVDNE